MKLTMLIKTVSIFLFGCMALVNPVFGQQDPLSMQYLNNYFLINPAYAGLTKDLNLSAGYRIQWAGFTGSPLTFGTAGHVSLNHNKMGMGFTINQDKIGPSKTTEVNAAYSYHITTKDNVDFSAGLQAGFINYRSDYSDLQINRNDPKFNGTSEIIPNVGAGFLMRSEKFLVSLAVPHLLPPSISSKQLSGGLYAQSLYFFSSYIFQLSYRVQMRPSMLFRLVKDIPVSTDYNLTIKIDDSYSIGAFTRNFNTAGFLAMLNIGDALRVGYVFEMPLNNSSALNFSSHEVMCGLRLKVLGFHQAKDMRSF